MKKHWRKAGVLLTLGFGLLVTVSVLSATAASNTVPQTRADKDTLNISINDISPPQCSGINLTNIVNIGDGETGTAGNDLILGTSGDDMNIRGGGGDDCILGGGGNDRRFLIFFWIPGLWGEDGNDVLIGGPGTDVCFGGNGTDTYFGCETEW